MSGIIKHLPGRHNQKTHGRSNEPVTLKDWLITKYNGFVDASDFSSTILSNVIAPDAETKIVNFLDTIYDPPNTDITINDDNEIVLSGLAGAVVLYISDLNDKLKLSVRLSSEEFAEEPDYGAIFDDVDTAAEKAGFGYITMDTHDMPLSAAVANGMDLVNTDSGQIRSVFDTPWVMEHLIRQSFFYLKQHYDIPYTERDVRRILSKPPKNMQELLDLTYPDQPELDLVPQFLKASVGFDYLKKFHV